MSISQIAKWAVLLLLELCAFPFLLAFAILSRAFRKKVDVGLGDIPLINNVYHKQALVRFGYSAETFVSSVYYITDAFDLRGDLYFWARPKPMKVLVPMCLFVQALFRYRLIYTYFNGSPLQGYRFFLWRAEPLFYKLSGTKVVVMPYGSDVQDLSRSPNLLFKHAISADYPRFRHCRQQVVQRIDLWTRHANHVISGCDWVDYLYHWDTLMLAHFSIDTTYWKPADTHLSSTLRILHAPNHRTIKGTEYFVRAVSELRKEGVDVELILLERVPNSKIRETMASVDAVADQLVIGWYAMFALEAMASAKPVFCHLRPDLESLYINAGLVQPGEIPILNCSPGTVKDAIRNLAQMDRSERLAIGLKCRAFVERHHSLATVGRVFDRINRSIGIEPSLRN